MIDVNKEYREYFRQFETCTSLYDHPDADKHGYNWRAACEYNDLRGLLDQTEELLFENNADTEHGEGDYAFIVRLKTGEFVTAEGWHDYTGWDCQSGLEICGVSTTIDGAMRLVSEKHSSELADAFVRVM